MARDIAKEQGEGQRLPVIGIVPSKDGEKDALLFPTRYAEAIVAAGGAPLMLPLSGDPRVYETLFPLIDGFVLTGGNDIDPARYGAVADSGKISEHSPDREELEYLILSYAYRFDLPLLGICRGMQMINVCLGGTLYRDLDDQFPGVRRPGVNDDLAELPRLAHWQKEDYHTPTHRVGIKPGSLLAEMMGTSPVKVNSMHHQGICEVSPKVEAVAWAEDGLVEGIEVRDRSFILGVQWHPEFFAKRKVKRLTCVFSGLIEAARLSHDRARGSVAIRTAAAADDAASQWPVITFAEYI